MKKRPSTNSQHKENVPNSPASYAFLPHHKQDEEELELIDSSERARFRPYLIPDYIYVKPVRLNAADLLRPAVDQKINLPEGVLTLDECARNSLIKQLIQQHCEDNDGVTDFGEVIDCYRYFPTPDDFIFYSTSGELLGDNDGSVSEDIQIGAPRRKKTFRRE